MKIELHLEKIKRIEKTITKLDNKEDYETIVEDLMIISSHYINASMHKLRTQNEENDIKHNKLYGALRKENKLENFSDEVGNLIDRLEKLRPSHIYGKGENGNIAKKAKNIYEKIKKICKGVLNG